MAALDDINSFDVATADLSLWVFKRTLTSGQAPKFSGKWVETTDALDDLLKSIISSERAKIEEVEEYSLLAQNNEGSALSITALETHAGLLIEQASAELPSKKVKKVRELENVPFYAIKLTSSDRVLFAVCKTGIAWRTKRKAEIFFSEDKLDVDDRQTFDIERSIDFFIVSDALLIRKKAGFESVLSYKQAHKDDFVKLQAEGEFAALFVDMVALAAHVGENKIQLRRMSSIKQKAHYKDPVFLENLRAQAAAFKLNLTFDDSGRMVVTPENCRDVMIALLDHRLMSAFSKAVYDVPNTIIVNV